ncbi:hypothetical protein FQN49_000576 [Arthroderma sp. PD_2]|nr:hypothetical protein FQN49_000576 [Arthroderma sp. PD_2]
MCCVNDMRAFYLCHDKRLLGVVLQELDSLVMDHQVLTHEQAEILRQGIVPSIIPGSPELEQLVCDHRKSTSVKDGYIIKPIRQGRGQDIMFGTDMTYNDWNALLSLLRDPRQTARGPRYVLQPVIKQPGFEVMDDNAKTRRRTIIGTCFVTNGTFHGMGVWKAAEGRICNISNGGFRLLSVSCQRLLRN